MSDFSFVGTVECDRCGTILESSDSECDECDDIPSRRYHFEHVSDDRIETVMAINPRRGWHELFRRVDEPIPWRCVETGCITATAGVDVIEVWEEYNDTE